MAIDIADIIRAFLAIIAMTMSAILSKVIILIFAATSTGIRDFRIFFFPLPENIF